jgi:hypothetical protein
VPNERVTQEDPILHFEQLTQIPFNFHRVVVVCEAQAACQTVDMRVDDEARRNAVAGAQHDVRRFARDSRQT